MAAYWNLDKPICYFDSPIGRVDNRTLKKIAVRAGVDPTNVNRYMLRHFMAKHIRAAGGGSKEEQELWLGHADPKHRQTVRSAIGAGRADAAGAGWRRW